MIDDDFFGSDDEDTDDPSAAESDDPTPKDETPDTNAPPPKDKTSDTEVVKKPARRSKASGSTAPRRLSIARKDLPIPKAEPTRYYHCGVTPECPHQVIHAGGIDFPLFVQKQVEKDGAPDETVLSNERYAGRVHELTFARVEKCLEGIASKVVRIEGQNRRLKSIHGSKTRPFVPMANDVPLAKFVYMVEVESPAMADRTMPPKIQVLLEE